MAGLNAADLVQITLEGRLNSQVILNTFHYQVDAPSITADYLTAINQVATWFRTNNSSPLAFMRDATSEDFTYLNVRAQKIKTPRMRYVIQAANQVGLFLAESLPQNCAVTIERYGIIADRKSVGSLHMCGVARTCVVEGDITAAAKTLYQLVADSLKNTITVGVGDTILTPVLPNLSLAPDYRKIIGVTVQDTARVMRRRTKGVGI